MPLILDRPVKITVCCDGFVSIMQDPKHRRLKAALPCHSCWTADEAIRLVASVCELRPCLHHGKLGMTLEPRAPNWPTESDAGHNIELIGELGDIFQKAEPNG